jgi:hypothetical protein
MTQPGAAIVNEWSEWLSDIEGKTTRVGASERGKRTSFKPPAGFANSDADPETLVIRREWSDRDERHGRLSREGSGRAERERARYNGATGMSDMAG